MTGWGALRSSRGGPTSFPCPRILPSGRAGARSPPRPMAGAGTPPCLVSLGQPCQTRPLPREDLPRPHRRDGRGQGQRRPISLVTLSHSQASVSPPSEPVVGQELAACSCRPGPRWWGGCGEGGAEGRVVGALPWGRSGDPNVSLRPQGEARGLGIRGSRPGDPRPPRQGVKRRAAARPAGKELRALGFIIFPGFRRR